MTQARLTNTKRPYQAFEDWLEIDSFWKDVNCTPEGSYSRGCFLDGLGPADALPSQHRVIFDLGMLYMKKWHLEIIAKQNQTKCQTSHILSHRGTTPWFLKQTLVYEIRHLFIQSQLNATHAQRKS